MPDVLSGYSQAGGTPARANHRCASAGDEYLRTLLVQGAHYILGPFGEDSDLRRWGKKLAAKLDRRVKVTATKS